MRDPFCTAVLAAIFSSMLHTEARARETAACHLDDPARFMALREKMKKRGERGADFGAELCLSEGSGGKFPEEIVLPLPCGIGVVFTLAITPTATPMGQADAYLGEQEILGEQPATKLSSGPWRGRVAGTFPVNGGRGYYIGKYELSETQWQVHELGLLDSPIDEVGEDSKACAAITEARERGNPRKVLPATGMDWTRAVAFSSAWSRWLLENDRARIAAGDSPLLPWIDGSTGYVRLPTEAEWEFAARGGAVDSAQRSERLYRVPTGDGGMTKPALSDVAHFTSGENQSLLSGIGLHQPNAFGLHDMLGNVEEVVLDLFRVVHPDGGLHGQIGGFLLRGGSSDTPRELIGVGLRRETPLHGLTDTTDAGLVGARFVVSAPVFTSARSDDRWVATGSNEARNKAMLEDRDDLLISKKKEERDAVDAVRTGLADIGEGGDGLREKAAELRVLLDTREAALNTAQREAIRDRFVSAVAVGWSIRQTGRKLLDLRFRAADLIERRKNDPPSKQRALMQKILNYLVPERTRLEAQYGIYLSEVTALAALEPKVFDAAFQEAGTKMRASGGAVFGALPDLVKVHVEALRDRQGKLDSAIREAWLDQLDIKKKQRETDFDPIP